MVYAEALPYNAEGGLGDDYRIQFCPSLPWEREELNGNPQLCVPLLCDVCVGHQETDRSNVPDPRV